MTSFARRTIVAAVLIPLVTLGLVACDSREDQAASAGGSPIGSVKPRQVALPRGVSASLPAGWHLVRKPINQVIYPVQVLAAASFPVDLGETTPGCLRVLDQKPPGGVLVQVIEYTRQPGLERFPPRERALRLPKRAYASYECAGPSYSVVFRDHRRALQAHVILDRHRVDPRIREQAIDLLSSMRFASPRADREVRREVIDGARRDFRAATKGPSGFADCFLARFGRELTRKELGRLVALRAAHGEPAAARALNGLGVEVGDVCGGRRWVPQLTEAASGLGVG